MDKNHKLYKTLKIKLTFVFFFLSFFLIIAQEKLPPVLWNNVKDYTFMYYPEPLNKGTEFNIQSNYHFLAFDYKILHLKDLRIINKPLPEEDAVREDLEFLPLKTDQDLLEIVMIYKGEEYILSKGVKKPSSCRLIEGGKFFQRRDITNIDFEEGAPKTNASIEIAAWPDRISIVLKNNFDKQLNDVEFQVRLKFPENYNDNIQQKKNSAIGLDSDGNGFLYKGADKAKLILKNNKIVISKTFKNKKNTKIALVIQTLRNIQKKDITSVLSAKSGLLKVKANQVEPNKSLLKTKYDDVYGWYEVDLRNDLIDRNGLERVKITLQNPTKFAKMIRLNFSKKAVRSITGISPVLRDDKKRPIGIPVQISKNWHHKLDPFKGPWFRGFTMVTIPAKKSVKLELAIASAFWGTLPAASHAQLSLVGWSNSWGSNQQWDQSAIGAFGESICYEVDGGQAKTMVTDVRPLMIKSTTSIKKPKQWGWTPNVGGADFFRFYNKEGKKQSIKRIKTHYKRYCPNLTEVTFAGVTENNEASYELITSIYRSDDYVRGVYKLKLKVNQWMHFDRLAIAQIGSETYSMSKEIKMAFGDESGLIQEWDSQWGGSFYKQENLVSKGEFPWISMHDAVNTKSKDWGAWANKGIIVKKWKARVNGKMVKPFFSEYGTKVHKNSTSLIEINLPKNTTTLQPGDFIETVITEVIIPQEADSYYGSNSIFKTFLEKHQNTWKPVYRESVGNTLKVSTTKGKVIENFPIKVLVDKNNQAEVYITKGVGYVPITFIGLTSYTDLNNLKIYHNNKKIKIKQEVNGNDFWQTDFNAKTNTWEVTFTLVLD